MQTEKCLRGSGKKANCLKNMSGDPKKGQMISSFAVKSENKCGLPFI